MSGGVAKHNSGSVSISAKICLSQAKWLDLTQMEKEFFEHLKN